MGRHPGGVLPQVKGHAGMENTDVLALKGGGVHLLQLGGGLGHQLAGELAPLRQVIAVQHGGLAAVRPQLGGIDHLAALLDLVAGHGVQGQAHVAAVAVGDLQHHVVDGGQIQQIGHGGIVAVLGQLLGDIADRDAAAVGGHALGQRRQCLLEGAELAPFHGLAAAGGQGLGGGELVVYQLGLGVFQKLHAVIGFHLRAETAVAGGLGIGLACKQLQVIQIVHHMFSPFFIPRIFPVRRFRS